MRKIIYGIVFLFFGLLVCRVDGATFADQQASPAAVRESIQPTQVQSLAKSTVSWDGSGLPAYPAGQPEIRILRIVIPAGQTLATHKHPFINAGVLLKGELTVQTEAGKTLHLKSGESIVEVVDTWHYGKNEGKEPAEIIMFYASAEGNSITVYKP
jgi:quercetin dioxygenase-like cupin family protein